MEDTIFQGLLIDSLEAWGSLTDTFSQSLGFIDPGCPLTPLFVFYLFFMLACSLPSVLPSSCVTAIDQMGFDLFCEPKKMLFSILGKQREAAVYGEERTQVTRARALSHWV